MHDFDRPLSEFNYEANPDSDPSQELFELDPEAGSDNIANEAGMGSLFEGADSGLFAESQDSQLFGESGDQAAPLDEADEMDLAAQLLEVQTDAEMDEFLKKIVSRVARKLPSVARTVVRVARPLAPVLKAAARQAIPWAARAAGAWLGGPAGAALAGQLAQVGMQQFGLELDGLSTEDQQYELSRRYVRFASNALMNAARNAPGAGDLRPVVRQAVTAAARQYIPGLVGGPVSGTAGGRHRRANARGYWRRFGSRIVLYGVR